MDKKMDKESYRNFAGVYDTFMDDVPYKQWAGHIDKVLGQFGIPKGAILLDIACGTGTMAFLMAQKGYELIGTDKSSDMLSEAYSKRSGGGVDENGILFLNQDILELDLYGTVDAAYSTCDSLNYLLTEEELAKALANVSLFLNPNGVFIFDLKTENKYRQMGDNTYNDIAGDASYIWKNQYNPDTRINEYRIHFLIEGGPNFWEVHRQRAFGMAEVKQAAQKAGLTVESVTDGYTDSPARADSERVVYVCKR